MLHSRIQRIGRSDIWSFSNVFYICGWSLVSIWLITKHSHDFEILLIIVWKKLWTESHSYERFFFLFLSEKITPCSHVIGIKISRILFNSFFYLHGNHVINAIMIYLCMGLIWPAFSQIKCNLDTFQIWFLIHILQFSNLRDKKAM